jgi:tetratricopeptide (TPR) repeat protein
MSTSIPGVNTPPLPDLPAATPDALDHAEQAPPDVAALFAAERALQQQLDMLEQTRDPAARAQLKTDIIALFRAVEAAEARIGALKSAVKSLAERWKSGEARVFGGGARAGQSGRVDHLGASTYVEKGWSRLALGDAAGAEQALQKALALAPGSSEAESLLGWAQMMQEQYDLALLTFHNVLLREPQNALARTNVGYICLRKKIYGEAIEHLSRAIRLDSDGKAALYAHLYLGLVYFDREMYDDARLFFHKALALGPNLLQAYFELGRAHWFSGDHEAARAAWRDGAAANKFNPWGKRCAEQLAAAERGEAPSREM